MRHCPISEPYLRLRRAGDESHQYDCLSLRFGDKLKARNLEVDFLVVDVPTAYNVILGRPKLHKVKAIIARTFSSSNLKQMTEA